MRGNGTVAYLLNANAWKALLQQCRLLGEKLGMNVANHLAVGILEVGTRLDECVKLLVEIRLQILKIRNASLFEILLVLRMLLEGLQILDILDCSENRLEGMVLLLDRMPSPASIQRKHFLLGSFFLKGPNEAAATTEVLDARTDWLRKREPRIHCRRV